MSAAGRMSDKTAAALDGLLPERLSRFVLTCEGPRGPGEVQRWYEEVEEYLRAHALVGYSARVLAERGYADHCPDWCVCGHDPVAIFHPLDVDGGREHVAGRWSFVDADGGDATIEVGAATIGGERGPVRLTVTADHGAVWFHARAAREYVAAMGQALALLERLEASVDAR